eukprot:2125163-Prymnesium_polylepis.2
MHGHSVESADVPPCFARGSPALKLRGEPPRDMLSALRAYPLGEQGLHPVPLLRRLVQRRQHLVIGVSGPVPRVVPAA